MINNIKFGIKISTVNFDLLDHIYDNKDKISFIEIIINPALNLRDVEVIKAIRMPYVIHLPNSNQDIDFGDVNRNKQNLDFINKINQYEKELHELTPICYIVHPESGNISLSIDNIKKLKIQPLALENMPKNGIYGEKMLGYDKSSLKKYFDNIKNLKFCFDINHAIKAAISMKKEYLAFIKEFLEFKNPILFHISGGNLNINFDEHLSIDKSQYNLTEIKKILLNYNKNVMLTFETPRDSKNNINDDLRNMEIFLKS